MKLYHWDTKENRLLVTDIIIKVYIFCLPLLIFPVSQQVLHLTVIKGSMLFCFLTDRLSYLQPLLRIYLPRRPNVSFQAWVVNLDKLCGLTLDISFLGNFWKPGLSAGGFLFPCIVFSLRLTMCIHKEAVHSSLTALSLWQASMF